MEIGITTHYCCSSINLKLRLNSFLQNNAKKSKFQVNPLRKSYLDLGGSLSSPHLGAALQPSPATRNTVLVLARILIPSQEEERCHCLCLSLQSPATTAVLMAGESSLAELSVIVGLASYSTSRELESSTL